MNTNQAGTKMDFPEVDPAQIAVAQRLGKDLIDCDSAILSLIVVDPLGRVLHVSRSARLPGSDQVSPELVQAFGTLAKVLVGAAEHAARVMGSTEAIVGIFKRQKVLLINLLEYNLLLALRLTRSANAEYISEKIGDLLATRGEP